MSVVENTQQYEEEQPKGWVPRVIRGGKGPPEGPVDDWLKELPLYTVFVCAQKNTYDGALFRLIFKGKKYYLLQMVVGKEVYDRYVLTKEFCKQHKEYEILGIDPPTEEVDNEQRNSHRPADLVLHETVQGVDQISQDPE